MFFSKNELIELENQKNYLILDTTMLNNDIFYQIQEVEGNNVIGKKSIIVAVNDDGNLFIEDVADENILTELKEIWAN